MSILSSDFSSVFAPALRPRSADMIPTKRRLCLIYLLLLCSLGSVGCTAILSPVSGVPARRLPKELLAKPRANLEPIDISRLEQGRPKKYLLDSGDVLAIYIPGVLDQADEAPRVNFPPPESDLPPTIGSPIPVLDDGTISLPGLPAIEVRGKTVQEAKQIIEKTFIEKGILNPEDVAVLVSLYQPREYKVLVVRQDQAQTPDVAIRVEALASNTQQVTLPAYQNDVLHALVETGGLPGLDAKSQVKIIRHNPEAWRQHDYLVQAQHQHFGGDCCACPPPLPTGENITTIPLRLPPGEVPMFSTEDIVLQDGDVILVESRETEVFYTSGLLPPGEHILPRDYDLDVLSAISLAGGNSLSAQGGGGGGGALGGIGNMVDIPPTQLFVIRKLPCGRQFTISVDLVRALRDPSERILVQPGDILVLQYKPQEETARFGIITFFTFGIQELLGGDN